MILEVNQKHGSEVSARFATPEIPVAQVSHEP